MTNPHQTLTTLTVALVVCLAGAQAAEAHDTPPTPAEAIAIGDRWVAAAAPGVPNHCARGALKVTYGNLGGGGIGWADGWVSGNVWDYAKCDAVIVPGLGPRMECWVRAHELMHFVIGPEHVGPLAPGSPGAAECFGHDHATPDHDRSTSLTFIKKARTRRQIARSMRHRRTMAKIRARAAIRAARR